MKEPDIKLMAGLLRMPRGRRILQLPNERGKKPITERLQWLDNLPLEDAQVILAYHTLCLYEKENYRNVGNNT